MNETKSTIKGLKKQMAAAVAMVTVAAVALGSSTYAWFANNNRVTADGLSITAQSEGRLLIIDDNQQFTNGEHTSVQMAQNETNAKKLLPTHPTYTLAGELTAWNHNTSDKYDTAISGNTNETTVTNGTQKADPYYYLSDEVYIKLAGNGSGETASNLKLTSLTVTPTGGANADASLLNAVRVMLVVNDTKTYVYNKEGQEVTTDRLSDGSNDFVYGNASVLADTVNSTTPVKVAVYVYFDGRDADCTSEKYDTDQFAVELGFGVDA